MKNNLALFSFLLIATLVLNINYTESSSGSAPIVRTGAPGESNCSGCHSGAQNPISGTTNIALNFDNGNTEYEAGQTYDITISVSDASKVRFGFSSTVLDSSNQPVGTLIRTNTNNTSLGNSGGRQYLGHRSAGSNQSWDFQWQAPASAQGDITFYIAAVAANNMGGNNGDNVYLNEFAITPATIPTPSSVDFFVSIDSTCVNTEVIFEENAQGNIIAYNWDFGSGAAPASASGPGPHLVNYSSAGNKTASLSITTTDQGVITKDTILEIFPIVTLTVLADTILTVDSIVQPFSLFASGADKYTWRPGFGLNNINSANPVFDPALVNFQGNDTTLTYEVFGEDANRICNDLKSVRITLQKESLSTNVFDRENENWRVYPHPVNDYFTLEAPENIQKVSILSLSGSLLFSRDLSVQKTVKIQRPDEIASGLYILKIESGNRTVIKKLWFN